MIPATPFRADVCGLDDLSARELYALMKMRVDVFIVEQACAFPDLDGKDIGALHVRLLDGETLLAAARILEPVEPNGCPRIGRVVVALDHRGKRLGEAVMRVAISECETRFPGRSIALSAQSHLEAFYASLGFAAVSSPYIEDGIPHVDMLKGASDPASSRK